MFIIPIKQLQLNKGVLGQVDQIWATIAFPEVVYFLLSNFNNLINNTKQSRSFFVSV